jgi:futalosine hydrolase
MNTKNVLLVSATTLEIRELLNSHVFPSAFMGNLVSMKHNEHTLDVLITGPGMVQTAYYLGTWMSVKHYDLAIHAGIAGSFVDQLPPGTVVNVISDQFPELGAETSSGIIPLYDMDMAKPYCPAFTGQGGMISNTGLSQYKALAQLPKAKGITVNTISGREESIEALRNQTGADIETMEGAAFFFACYSADIPCIQLRAVSNRIEPRNLNNWDTDLAIKNLNKILKQLLDEI